MLLQTMANIAESKRHIMLLVSVDACSICYYTKKLTTNALVCKVIQTKLCFFGIALFFAFVIVVKVKHKLTLHAFWNILKHVDIFEIVVVYKVLHSVITVRVVHILFLPIFGVHNFSGKSSTVLHR